MRNWEALKAMSEGRVVCRSDITRGRALPIRINGGMFEHKSDGKWAPTNLYIITDASVEWEVVEPEWEEVPARDVIGMMLDQPELEWEWESDDGVWHEHSPGLVSTKAKYHCRPRRS